MAKQAEAPRKQLPARSSRGTRIRQLVGEEADADASFWGQAAWLEDGEDADYSTEEEEEDVVDSDFDEREDPDEDVHDEDADGKDDDIASRGRKRGGGVYREPLKALTAKKPRVPPAVGAVVGIPDSGAAAVAPPPPAVFQYEAPTVRRSTARKSSESSELRKRATEEAARGRRQSDAKASAAAAAAGGHGPAGGSGTRLTQAQLLAEAVRTEVENVRSLSRLEQLEEEKRAESITPKAPPTGCMVRVHSRLGAPKTITFLNAAEFPALFRQPKPRKRERPSSSVQQQLRQQEEEERPEDGGGDGERERRGSGTSERESCAHDVALTAQ